MSITVFRVLSSSLVRIDFDGEVSLFVLFPKLWRALMEELCLLKRVAMDLKNYTEMIRLKKYD